MKQRLLATVLASACTLPFAAVASEAPSASPLSFNVGVVSDYLFRGVSQTHGKPAVQAGVDYAFASGFYVGAWASNITWIKDFLGSGRAEVDVYGGYKRAIGDWGYDVGYITYNYPGHGKAIPGTLANPNTQEAYISLNYKWLAAKYSYATSSHFIGWFGGENLDQKTRGSDYLELNANYDLGSGWTLIGHVGHQKVKRSVTTASIENANYTDWKLGATKDVGFGTVGLAYSDTNAKGACGNPFPTAGASSYCWGTDKNSQNYRDVAKGTVVLSFMKMY